MSPPPDEHDCGWKVYAKDQAAALADVREQLAEVKRRLFARKSEKRRATTKLPPPLPPDPVDPTTTAATRATARAKRRATMPTETVDVAVPADSSEFPNSSTAVRRSISTASQERVDEADHVGLDAIVDPTVKEGGRAAGAQAVDVHEVLLEDL